MIQFIEKRTVPDRLRHVADRLEAMAEVDWRLLSYALVLRQTADELEADE